jgi:HlyD family secretion protein
MKDGKADLRPVTTGLTGETNIEILSGIEAGDEIVVGSYRLVSRELQHGDPVKKAEKSKGKQGGGHGRGGGGDGERGGGN